MYIIYRDYLLSKSCSAHLRNKLMAAICKNTKSADAEVKQIVSHVMITLQSLTSGVMTTEEKSKRQSMIDSNAKVSYQYMHAVIYVSGCIIYLGCILFCFGRHFLTVCQIHIK